MLREYAFTPHVLDESANTEPETWQECMRSIAQAVWPDRAVACPIVVSGLHGDGSDCSWRHVAATLVNAITDHVVRTRAQSLLARLCDLLVLRPACDDWPGDDEPSWLNEADDTRRVEQLMCIITSLTADDPGRKGRRLDAVREPGFWGGLPQTISPEGSMKEQVALLRPLLVHADYYELSVPYAGLRDFACEIIREANRRPASFRTPEFDVYNVGAVNPDALMHYLRGQLSGLGGTGRVRWHFWPFRNPYRERVLLAGRLAQVGQGKTQRGPRWGVSMTHVPGEGQDDEAAPTTWSLLSADGVRRHVADLKKAIKSRAPVLKVL